MKIHLTFQQLTVLLFGLSLAAFASYVCQLSFSVYDKTDIRHPLTSELIESRRQNGIFDNDAVSSHLHNVRSTAYTTTEPSLSLHPFVDVLTHAMPLSQDVQADNRRILVRQWHHIAMTVDQLPVSRYQHILGGHRLGGWKETNIQFRAISQRA